ncbi:beta strand repeat-containing protein [Candidatus Finniella inopinata]|uniref:Right-handed parallel beta-helix repeat-containing protein n=1 Tax=Candidatus Finniella inopinata TaxID=1696036 RepID=A0A4Q7DKN8_9PROT|nr:hypothetical protein [Candidatus Finniella inopinata]RZI46664.1 hypothetical protein EQU50_03515 [Candidatus Finniella inopinata]
MRSSLFLLGVSLSAMSCAYGNVAMLSDSGAPSNPLGSSPYATINAALNAAATGGTAGVPLTTTPVLTLTGDDTAETTENTLPSTITSLTINGGGHTIPRQTGAGNFTLLRLSGTLDIYPSNVTFSNFSNNSTLGAIVGGVGVNLNHSSISGDTTSNVIFSGNNSLVGGVYGTQGVVSFTNTNLVTLTSNSADAGGAISCNGLTLSGTRLVTFSNNSAGDGGAIWSRSDVDISGPTAFTNNTARRWGGAVFMANPDFATYLSYNVTNPVTLNPQYSTPALATAANVGGDNDIAAAISAAMFIKAGTGTLTLNTVNVNWLGNTTVNAGSLIIGDSSHTSAQWGPNPSASPSQGTPGTITVNGGTLGGYGQIHASAVTFGAGSTWQVGFDSAHPTVARLNVTGALSLDPRTIIDATQVTLTPGTNYTMATYGTLIGSLSAVNILQHNPSSSLSLSQTGSGPYTLSLTLTAVPPIPAVPTILTAGSDGTNHTSLHGALTTTASTTPSLTFTTAADTVEATSTNLSSFTGGVSITGAAGGTTIIPATGFTGSLLTTSGSNALLLKPSNLTFSGFSSTDSNFPGSVISCANALTINPTNQVTFTGNSSSVSTAYAGAISAGQVTITGTKPMAFTGNTSSNGGKGGAAISSSGAVQISSPVTFTENSVMGSANGGAIYSLGQVEISEPATFKGNSSVNRGGAIYAPAVGLTDTQFANNTATTSGGAVYTTGNFTYNVTKAVTLNPQYSTSTAATAASVGGDNDIACQGGGSMFTVNAAVGKTGTLTLNTVNANWLGGTTVNAGGLIIGDSSNPSAQWGSAVNRGAINVGSTTGAVTGGTLGGYGTIYATSVNFVPQTGTQSTWLIGINPTGTTPPCGVLNMTGQLTLPSNIEMMDLWHQLFQLVVLTLWRQGILTIY